MIDKIWLYPPLAFARVGGSPEPCDNFQWGPNDLSPAGTGRTQLVGARSLTVDADGHLSDQPPGAELVLKDDKFGFRKVCPFFELWGSWTEGGQPQQITDQVLKQFGLTLDDVQWTVRVANRKAWHFTRSAGDVVEASVPVCGGDTKRVELKGASPGDAATALVSSSRPILLGSMQLTKPSPGYPGLRLRFTPPDGLVYAPANLVQRLAELDSLNEGIDAKFQVIKKASGPAAAALAGLIEDLKGLNERWRDFELPASQSILNPDAAWPRWAWPNVGQPLSLDSIVETIGRASNPQQTMAALDALQNVGDRSELTRFFIGDGVDAGNLPPGVFAFLVQADRLIASLGLVDDISDGFVEVRLQGVDRPARARVVVTPPAVVPDRRSVASPADGLADRVLREQGRTAGWTTGANAAQAAAEVHDLLERAYETSGLQNCDAVLDFFRQENASNAALANLGLGPASAEPMPPACAVDLLWRASFLANTGALPLTSMAWRHHRRNATPAVLDSQTLDDPAGALDTMRTPVDGRRYYDKRMPGLMRGHDRWPLHLTRLQYELLRKWIQR